MADGNRPTRTRRAPSRPHAAAAPGGWIDPYTRREIKRLVAHFGSPLLIVDCERVRRQYHQRPKFPRRRSRLRPQHRRHLRPQIQ